MKKILNILLIFLFSFVLFSCNQNRTEEEVAEIYKKSTERDSIIERSGTPWRAGVDEKKLKEQLQDAEDRLRTGGGMFGKKPTNLFDLGTNNENKTYAAVGLPINPYLWRGSLETIDFMPLASADPFAGIIITEWYTDSNNPDERCKINIFIKGLEMKTSNLKVNSFCQILINGNWLDQEINKNNNAKLENAILNKAKRIRLSQS